jgi:hypothetical protein
MINSTKQYYYLKGLLRYFYSTAVTSWKYAGVGEHIEETTDYVDYIFYLNNLVEALTKDYLNHEE